MEPETGSAEWYNKVVGGPLGYTQLKPWQLTGITELRAGRDVFAVAPTGEGKSTVILGAVLADQAEGLESMAVILNPTKSLANDQVSTRAYSPSTAHTPLPGAGSQQDRRAYSAKSRISS
ncbi:hypothetical protein FS749_015864 [Ceratobasidium sp. UAMH 11750]|nr:hypothetical protein FS749_015864 [Ceratobasidium sp. UAMH 11750]